MTYCVDLAISEKGGKYQINIIFANIFRVSNEYKAL